MPFGIPRLKKVFAAVLLSLVGGAALVSCGYKAPTNTKNVPSGIKFRAFVSNPLSLSTGTPAPALNIVDASSDLLSTFRVNMSLSVPDAGFMALAPNKAFTLVFSPISDSVAIVNNTREGVQSSLNLPGPTQSMFVWTNNETAYAAIPTVTASGGSGLAPGEVVAMDLPNTVISATIPVAGAQYVVDSHSGSRILAFGNSPQTVTIITPSQIGTATDPRTVISSSSFDHPVWGIFSSDDTIAYILSCGPECGGSAASVAVLDVTQTPPQVTATIAVPSATYGILNGSTLYVAGTSSGGGTLSVIGTSSDTVLNANPIAITDGYHDRMAITANGELFIGARTCTAGCLSIFNPATSAVVVPATTGDVTGIQPITGRNVVYVCEAGALNIYDSAKNVLQKTQVDIVGQAVDVELVDSP